MTKTAAVRVFAGCASVILAAGGAMPVMAGTPDRMGYRAIAAGDFVAAERSITAERRIFPHRPELTLNLATVYSRTGRVEAARALYREVLSAAPVDLVLADGDSYSSHALAEAGLARLPRETVAAR